MEAANRDIGIQYLQNLINQRKNNLYDAQKNLRVKSKDNIYLRDIVDDYSDIENKNQYTALQLLNEYITQITLDPTSTEEMLRNCKYDRSLIASEIKKLNIKN